MSTVTGLSGACTTPVVRDEIERGVENHPYLQSAVDAFEREMPVVCISEAVADVHDGRLLAGDGDARTFAREQSVTVVGSVGILLAAVDAGQISESTANRWLRTWIDEFGYYAPHRRLGDYR